MITVLCIMLGVLALIVFVALHNIWWNLRPIIDAMPRDIGLMGIEYSNLATLNKVTEGNQFLSKNLAKTNDLAAETCNRVNALYKHLNLETEFKPGSPPGLQVVKPSKKK